MVEKKDDLNNIGRRDFLRKFGIIVGGAVVAAAGGKLLFDALTDENPETLFDKKHYLDISGDVKESYMDHDLLLEEMPTVYDNILYAKEIYNIDRVEDTVIYTACNRMKGLEKNINTYASRYHMPANKLLGLILLESEGKPNVGNKSLNYKYNCYGYTQLSVLVAKKYGAIKETTKIIKKKGKSKKKTVLLDKRDSLPEALDATCKFLTDIHKKRVNAGYQDQNRSLTFATYHMGETHMNSILKTAKEKNNGNINTMQDTLSINDKELANKFMDLKDESYKYYPKLLAAGRIYSLFKSNRARFNHNVQEFLESPIRRKPSLSEEYLRHGQNTYYKTNEDIKKSMEREELFGVIKTNDNVKLDDDIGEKNITIQQSDEEQEINQNVTYEEQKELMKMSSKATRGLIKFISHHYAFNTKLTSLTRSEIYNDAMYKINGKWTSHATGYAFDLGFPHNLEEKRYLKWILYGLEVQGKIAFIQEKNHFHVIINPKYKDFFEGIANNKEKTISLSDSKHTNLDG